MSAKISAEEGCELCSCGCILAKHYSNFVPGENFCSTCSKCLGFCGTGRIDQVKVTEYKKKERLSKRRVCDPREAARRRMSGEWTFKGFGIRQYGMVQTTASLLAAQQTAVTHGGEVVAVKVAWKEIPICSSCFVRRQILVRCPECHGSGKATVKRLAGNKR